MKTMPSDPIDEKIRSIVREELEKFRKEVAAIVIKTITESKQRNPRMFV